MSLTPVIDHYETVLTRFGQVVEFDISGLDRLGIPVTSCSLAVDGAFRHHGNGYGATDEAARVSGLGELAEGVVSADRVWSGFGPRAGPASYAELVAAEGRDRVADPGRCACRRARPTRRRGRWSGCRPTRVRTGETVWLPEEFVASEPGEVSGPSRLITPITNGLGAGLDDDRALTHGMLEMLQRHTNGLRFRALDRRSPVIAPETLPASVQALVDRFAASRYPARPQARRDGVRGRARPT